MSDNDGPPIDESKDEKMQSFASAVSASILMVSISILIGIGLISVAFKLFSWAFL